MKNYSFNFKFSIGLTLIIVGLIGSIYSAKELPPCDNRQQDNSCNYDSLIKSYTFMCGIDNDKERIHQKHMFREIISNCLKNGDLKINKKEVSNDSSEAALVILATSIKTFPEKTDKNLIFKTYNHASGSYAHHSYYDAILTLIKNGFINKSDTTKVSQLIGEFRKKDITDNSDDIEQIYNSLK